MPLNILTLLLLMFHVEYEDLKIQSSNTYFQEKIFKSNLHEYIVSRKDLQIRSSWPSTYFQEKIFKSNWHYISHGFCKILWNFHEKRSIARIPRQKHANYRENNHETFKESYKINEKYNVNFTLRSRSKYLHFHKFKSSTFNFVSHPETALCLTSMYQENTFYLKNIICTKNVCFEVFQHDAGFTNLLYSNTKYFGNDAKLLHWFCSILAV